MEGGHVREVPLSPPRVALALSRPAPLANKAGPVSASCPALGISPLPPLALGGMGGDALIGVGFSTLYLIGSRSVGKGSRRLNYISYHLRYSTVGVARPTII